MRKRGICILLSLLLLAAAAVGCRQNGERPTDSGTDSTARKDITTVPGSVFSWHGWSAQYLS